MATLREPFALDRSLNTTESPSRNIADVLAEELSAMITAIGGLNFINFVVVAELPTTGISTTTIYLVPSDDPQSENTYDEYINLNGTVSGWEKIGSTDIDLSGYYTSAEVDDLLADKADVSDIPTVNDGTLTIQQNGDTKGTFTANQSGNSTVNIEIPTTDIQTAVDEFETYNGGLLSSLKVALSPNQDLHGYDSPWVGGAGKNKLPLILADIKSANTSGTWSGNVYTISGGTFEVLVDDADNVLGIKVNGTFNANTYFDFMSSFDSTYFAGMVFNGVPSASSGMVRISKSDRVALQNIYGYDTPIVDNGSNLKIAIRVAANITVYNELFYPMIRLSTESDPTFEPYSNICPISGHTQVDIDVSDGQATQEQVTVNLGGTYYSGTLDVVTGVFTLDKVKAVTPTRGALDSSGKLYTISFSGGTIHNYNSTAIATPYVMCSHLDVDSLAGARDTQRKCICQYAGAIFIGGYVGEETALDNMLASADFSIVFELDTPLTIQLSPTMVKALVGENHLSAPLDGQEITESKYKQMFTFDDVIAYIQSLS